MGEPRYKPDGKYEEKLHAPLWPMYQLNSFTTKRPHPMEKYQGRARCTWLHKFCQRTNPKAWWQGIILQLLLWLWGMLPPPAPGQNFWRILTEEVSHKCRHHKSAQGIHGINWWWDHPREEGAHHQTSGCKRVRTKEALCSGDNARITQKTIRKPANWVREKIIKGQNI